MTYKIKAIPLPLLYGMGNVNCYLIASGEGFILIDSGVKNKRAWLEKELDREGCKPGRLKLIFLTHGDFDHSSNAAYLSRKFGAPLAMHAEDAATVEQGDMFLNRKPPNRLIRLLVPLLFGFGKAKKFRPDLLLKEGDDLSEYGLDAVVLHLPGHSKGSIGVLTAEGDLLCGDLFDNTGEPGLTTLVDDSPALQSSYARIKKLKVNRVYPGHGKSFAMEQLA